MEALESGQNVGDTLSEEVTGHPDSVAERGRLSASGKQCDGSLETTDQSQELRIDAAARSRVFVDGLMHARLPYAIAQAGTAAVSGRPASFGLSGAVGPGPMAVADAGLLLAVEILVPFGPGKIGGTDPRSHR